MQVVLRRSRFGAAVSTLLLTVTLLAGPGSGIAAAEEDGAAGHVYVLNNNLLSGANSITVFARAANGGLSRLGVPDIGGRGSLAAFADGTQGSLIRTRDGRFAYTSNADSQAISGYRIQPDGSISLLDPNGATATTPADTFPLEEGLSRNSRFLYVLDSRLLLPTPGPVTLSGFQIDASGHLSSVLDPATISLPFSAIGLAVD